MAQYIVKRLLIMVPTFLLITLLVFVVINLAPGNPGQSQNASGSEQADQNANAREGYRLFKEQYNLDKPIIFNTRFSLEREDVTTRLETVARNMGAPVPGEDIALHVGETTARVVSNLANTDYYRLQRRLAEPDLGAAEREQLREELQNLGFVRMEAVRPPRPPQGRVFDAEEELENWGNDIVPFLLEIAHAYVHVVPIEAEDPYYDGRGVMESALPDGVGPTTTDHFELDGTRVRVHPLLTQKVRFLAVQRLSVNARRRVIIGEGARATPEEIAQNREIMSENARIAQWTYDLDATREEKQEVLDLWAGWFEQSRERFEKDAGDKVAMFFIETRFAKYWANLATLNLGTSIRYRRPVLEVIGEHWRYSIYLSLLSLFLAYFVSVPLGILAAVKQNSFADRGVAILLFVLYSLPSFFVATLLQQYLTAANGVDIFPVSGFSGVDPMNVTLFQYVLDVLWHLILPVICLTYAALAVLSRYARTGLLDVIRSDYIRTARAKGLSEWVVILKHAVRNGMIPILTLLGTTLPVLIGGSIIIEYIFVIEGMGKLMITAIQFRDYNIIMGVLLISAILTLLGILFSDISYALVDPRISFD